LLRYNVISDFTAASSAAGSQDSWCDRARTLRIHTKKFEILCTSVFPSYSTLMVMGLHVWIPASSRAVIVAALPVAAALLHLLHFALAMYEGSEGVW
jgi:hypothetical protein